MKSKFISRVIITFTVIVLTIGSGFLFYQSRTAPAPDSSSFDPNRVTVGPLCINADGAIYAMRTSTVDIQPNIWDIAGFINYNINNLSAVPTENNQANFDCLFSPYAWINESLYLYYNGSWHICYPI